MKPHRFYSIDELVKESGIPRRTLHSRLHHLSFNPKACKKKVLRNKVVKFYYNSDFINPELLLKGVRRRKRPVKRKVNLNIPPIYVIAPDGNEYNLFGLKALLRVITNEQLLRAFMAMHVVILIAGGSSFAFNIVRRMYAFRRCYFELHSTVKGFRN